MKTVTLPWLKALARVAPGVASFEHQAVGRLQALIPPSSIKADWQQILAGMQQLADDNTQLTSYAQAGNVKAAELLVSASRLLRRRLAAIAARDGLTYCGRAS